MIYCVTHQNQQRKQRMTDRFNQLLLPVTFVESTGTCMDGHMECLQRLVDSGDDLAIICEDDIHIRKDFTTELPDIITQFKKRNLEMLMLGYLLDFSPITENSELPLKDFVFTYHDYHSSVWGTQMYMIDSNYAKHILAYFGPQSGYEEYSKNNQNAVPYSSDHIITKMSGRKALIYPMMAVEEGVIRDQHKVEDVGTLIHVNYHKNCHLVNYDSSIHI